MSIIKWTKSLPSLIYQKDGTFQSN